MRKVLKDKKRINTKAKGNRNERRSMDFYEKQGYYCTKSSASLGLWDVIAYSKSDWLVIQIKTNRRPSSLEIAAMREEMVPPGTKKIIHVWKDYQRAPEIEEL